MPPTPSPRYYERTQVQTGGKSMLDHYPYSASATKEVNSSQAGSPQPVGWGAKLG